MTAPFNIVVASYHIRPAAFSRVLAEVAPEIPIRFLDDPVEIKLPSNGNKLLLLLDLDHPTAGVPSLFKQYHRGFRDSPVRVIALKPSFGEGEVDRAYALGAAAFASTPEHPADMPPFIEFLLYYGHNWNRLLDLFSAGPYRRAPKEKIPDSRPSGPLPARTNPLVYEHLR